MQRHKKQRQGTDRLTLDLWPDTANILGLSRGTVFRAARRGEIPVIRIGRRMLVSKTALDQFLQIHQVTSGGDR